MGTKSIETAYVAIEALRCALQMSDSADARDAMDRLYICVDSKHLAPTSLIATDLRSAIRVQLLPEDPSHTLVYEADAAEVSSIVEGNASSEISLSFRAPNSIVIAGEYVDCFEAKLRVLSLFARNGDNCRTRIPHDVDLRSLEQGGYIMLSASGVGWFNTGLTGLGCIDLDGVEVESRFSEPAFSAMTVLDAGRLSQALKCFSAIYAVEVPGGRLPVRLFGVSWRNLVEVAIMPMLICPK